ncbi:MAG TPA: class I SAM-dependent methyltransferase, partial [Candidatus Sulfotelmatobacter sp.]|nr:class I SAM-dependent methyltransferase [Candidatus Sulfotelmatobacter sp.]
NAARLHYDVQGIEPSQQAAKYAREQLKLNVRTGSLEEASLPAASFAAVTLIDVIEHLTDPMGALRHAHRLLQPNGCLYLVTHNIGSLTARLLGKRWWGAPSGAHLLFLTVNLESDVGESGLRGGAVPFLWPRLFRPLLGKPRAQLFRLGDALRAVADEPSGDRQQIDLYQHI